MNIKKVTLKELGELESWKMEVTPEISEKVQRYLIDNCGCKWNHTINVFGIDKPFLYMGAFENKFFGWDDEDCRKEFINFKSIEVDIVEEKEQKNDFKSQQAIWEWLFIDGNVVESIISSDKYIVKDGSLYNFKTMVSVGIGFYNVENWKKVIKKEWYEEIPANGRLCWIKSVDVYFIALIKSYNVKTKTFNEKNTVACYFNASPLTNEEIKSFLAKD